MQELSKGDNMENLQIYNRYKSAPPEALKPISGGRMSGMTDINPMWRIKCLTEQFGACGFGWYYKITNRWLEQGPEGQVSAFVDIELFVKADGEWSMPISGTGGSSFVALEKSGLKMSDECFKMATTDAISVACKQLGFGADVYWNKDKTKYDRVPTEDFNSNGIINDAQKTSLRAVLKSLGLDEKKVFPEIKDLNLTNEQFGVAMQQLRERKEKEKKEGK